MTDRMMKTVFAGLAALAALAAGAETVVDVVGTGAGRETVSVDVAGNPAFAKALKRNLELSGAFTLSAKGAVRVTGAVGGEIKAVGKGRQLTMGSQAADDKAVRMEARRLADRMCESFAGQKGFACDQVAFVSRQGGGSALCVCYPDGYDIRQLSSDVPTVVGPRWRSASKLLYTGYRNAGPQIFEYDVAAKSTRLLWSFKGLATGAAISPDGTRAAVILSMHGNPELYVIDIAAGTWRRLTVTKSATEGQPAWSPDGRRIVYVSDETRHPQLYVIDVETKAKRRLTSVGSQNVDPDWGADGRICYITKRGGSSRIAVVDPAEGDRTAQLVGEAGGWEHPSWARDGRHVVAGRDRAIFIVDTAAENPDAPRQLFLNAGNWITPSWSR